MASTTIHVVSGFLGAGKTTFLKKMIPFMTGTVALIENEYGQVGIDGDLIGDTLPKREIYAGCICCSIAGDFEAAIKELVLEHHPEHLFIEPSGVGSLSEILKVCKRVARLPELNLKIGRCVTLVDVGAFEDYSENFGSFYLDQIEHAQTILLSRIHQVDEACVERTAEKIVKASPSAVVLKDDWLSFAPETLWSLLESAADFSKIGNLETQEESTLKDKNETRLPSASTVFSTVSVTHLKAVEPSELERVLMQLGHERYGRILRAKGFLPLIPEGYIHFDYTPYHCQWNHVVSVTEPKVAVIGTYLNHRSILHHFSGGL